MVAPIKGYKTLKFMGDDRHQGENNMNSEQFIKSVENGEYPINKELLDNLYLEQEDLLKKMAKYRDKGDVGTYKNLVRSLADVTALIDNMWRNTPIKPIEKWQEKFSHYHSDGKELISTWEQKGEDIRNEKIYEVKGMLKDDRILTKQYGESTDIIDLNNPMIFYYEKDKDLDIKNFKLSVKVNESNQCNSFSDSHNTVKSSTSFIVKPSKYLLFSVNDGDLTRIEHGNLTKFDLSNSIKDGMNSIKIISNTQYRVTVSYECEGYISM